MRLLNLYCKLQLFAVARTPKPISKDYDPICRLKNWLEAIAVGVEQCSFSFDPKGDDIRINVRPVTYVPREFSIAEYMQEIEAGTLGSKDR